MSLGLIQLLATTTGDGGPSSEKVQLSDLQDKLREFSTSTQVVAAEAARPALGAMVGAAVVAVAAVYLLGRRRGRRQASVLTIKRV